MTRPRIIVLGWIGSTNLGDELIAEEACDLIRTAGGEPTLVTIDAARSTGLNAATTVHKGALDHFRLTRELLSHQGVVFGGGGLIQDETGPLNLPFHLSRLGTARVLRRPWIGFGLGFGAVRRRSGRALVRAVFRGALAVTVRDQNSAVRCEQLTGHRPVLAADPVFTRSVDEMAPTDHVVVSLRRPNSPDQRRLQTTQPPDATWIQRWADVIDGIAEPRGLAVRFVAWERSQDHQIHEAVAQRLRSSFVLETPDASEIVGRMGAGRLVLTMRYHGAISALLHGRPTTVIDYSPKMGDLVAESMGGLALVPVDVGPDAVSAAFLRIDAEAAARDRALHALRNRARQNRSAVDLLIDRCG